VGKDADSDQENGSHLHGFRWRGWPGLSDQGYALLVRNGLTLEVCGSVYV
jgi:hypothetical protein